MDSYQEDVYESLFLRSAIPTSIAGKKITNKLCREILLKYRDTYSVYFNEKEVSVMRRIFTLIDEKISFPKDDSFKNFKRKALKLDDQNHVQFFYNNNSENLVGNSCSLVGLTVSKVNAFVKGDYDLLVDLKGKCVVSYKLTHELYRYFTKESYSLKDLFKLICFLSGKPYNDHEYSVLYSRVVNASKKLTNIHLKSPKDREVCKKMGDSDFFGLEKASDEIDHEKEQYANTIMNYEKELISAKQKWEYLSDENERLRSLLFEEQTSNSFNSEHCDSLQKLLDDREKEYHDACITLRTLLENGTAICVTSMKSKQVKLKNDLEAARKHANDLSNVNNSLDKKLEDMSKDLELKKKELEVMSKKYAEQFIAKRNLQKLKSHYRNRIAQLNKDNINIDLDSTIRELKSEVTFLENEKEQLQFELKNVMEKGQLIFKNPDGSYTNNVRACYQDLVLEQVGINNIRKVIVSVLKNLANIDVSENELPGPTFARMQYEEARLLACAQLGTTLSENYKDANNTLQSDGTSKFGKHFGTYDVSTKSGENFVLGLRPMASGDAETVLSELRSVLKDIESVCNGTTNKVANKVLVSVKNTMSDRHIVQKKFNNLLEAYRSEVLPDVMDEWSNMSDEEKDKMRKMNSLFCGLHYVVGLAEQAEGALKVFDKLLYDDRLVGSLAPGGCGFNNGESGTSRLIRTLCKAVEEHGCEKSGKMVEFALALAEDGINKNPLIQFRGNRFNIIFYNGGASYYLHKSCKKFFETYNDNNLLRAVNQDLDVKSYIAGCRALGLINKFLTGPLWRLLVKVENVLEMNKYYQRIEELCAKISEDASDFLKGKVIFFDEYEGDLMHRNHIYNSLMEPNENYDELTKQLLEIIFGSFSVITKRMLADHLKDGKLDKANENLYSELESCPTTNVYPESNFGVLDRLMREMPNANEITIESIIMCKSNKMKRWRDNLDENNKNYWMNWVKKTRKQHYEEFVRRRQKIQELRNDKRLSKIEDKKRREIRLHQIKEELCKKIEKYSGLWKTVYEVENHFNKIKSDKEKIEALKCQLQFRQKVLLEREHVDSSLFHFSSKGLNFTSARLKENLIDIISCMEKVNSNLDASVEVFHPIPLSVPVEKLNREKERLKLLMQEPLVESSLNNELEPPCKKVKKNIVVGSKKLIKSRPIPKIDSINDLVGKRVAHFCEGDKGNYTWCNGSVLCIKPGSGNSELVIRYDGYKKLYSFDYAELADGLLKVIPLDPENIIGMYISQKFTNENEVDIWTETGKILGYKPATGLYTVSYFQDKNTHSLDDESYDENLHQVYEIEDSPLEEDYVNHDLNFI